MINPRAYLSIRQVCELLNISDTTLRRMRQAGVFPEPELIFRAHKVWQAHVVYAWIAKNGGGESVDSTHDSSGKNEKSVPGDDEDTSPPR